ncbi:FIST N-terminal domain-containing protein [Roseofilum sp. BLCC_M91]|uniref:FIST N-terminal domain-containing protein n=1 Tax=Roseofilum halophilum BLCC-M91 TaxID=3022259 RepID=A0ABT7BFB6_9CYAN|nr:FIST N-terminal domain-containing protein [Roseofilum halophilum]MDJ1177865.1 FIST N-terminal domain-containing protein [Roseofilum halophilum BLCC-M91]
MQWANALSTRPSLEAAIAEVVETVHRQISEPASIGLVFISSAFTSEFSRLMPLLQEKLNTPVLIGCGGGGIIGMVSGESAEEFEDRAALSLTLARLPGVQVNAFHIDMEELPDLDGPPDPWVELVGVSPERHPHFILLGDPMSPGLNDLLQGLDFAYPHSLKVGGLASSSPVNHGSSLFYNYELYSEGIVGLALSGNIALETIVAQGCRPIGSIYQITKAERNIVLELQEQEASGFEVGKTGVPLEILRSAVARLSEEDRELAQDSLFVGVATDSFKRELEAEDFLIRNLLGIDPRIGALAIAERVRIGQRIQFHLRDALASEEELENLLKRYQQELEGQTGNQLFSATARPSRAGALMFTCLGRGEQLYDEPNVDSGLFQRYFPSIPLSGFFCQGEIGPVGGNTFLHGYTSVFAIFYPQSAQETSEP